MKSDFQRGWEEGMLAAAGIAYSFSQRQHIVHSMKAGCFPEKSHLGVAISDAIRDALEEGYADPGPDVKTLVAGSDVSKKRFEVEFPNWDEV